MGPQKSQLDPSFSVGERRARREYNLRLNQPCDLKARPSRRARLMDLLESIEKKEKVFAILWEFAQNIQTQPLEGLMATSSDRVRIFTQVREAAEKIMENFGYSTGMMY